MKHGIAAVLIVGALLSMGGSTLAAGKLGGASGVDVAGQDSPLFAGSSADAIDVELARADGLRGTLTASGGEE